VLLPLQTILPSDLVGSDQPAADSDGRLVHFFKFEVRQTTIIVSRGLPQPTQKFKNF
jgi:hypothetical protein